MCSAWNLQINPIKSIASTMIPRFVATAEQSAHVRQIHEHIGSQNEGHLIRNATRDRKVADRCRRAHAADHDGVDAIGGIGEQRVQIERESEPQLSRRDAAIDSPTPSR